MEALIQEDIGNSIREGIWEGFLLRHMWPVGHSSRVFHANRIRRIISDVRRNYPKK